MPLPGGSWHLMCALTLLSSVCYSHSSAQPYTPSRVIIKLAPGASIACRDSAIASVSGTIIDSLHIIPYYLIALPDTGVQAASAELSGWPCIGAAGPNMLTEGELLTTTPDDSLYSLANWLKNTGQFGGTPGADIDAEHGWDYRTDASDVVVAIIDTGIDYYHEDLVANLWLNEGEIGLDGNGQNKQTNQIDDDGNNYVDDVRGWNFFNDNNVPYDNAGFAGHGTAVAGMAGAVGNNGKGHAGVAWSVQLMPLRITSSGGIVSFDPWDHAAAVAGRLVRTLADGLQTAGSHSIVWDGRNDAGAQVHGGVYFCKMDVGSWTSMKKMVFIAQQ